MSTDRPALDGNGLRQCLRIAFGGLTGLVISKLMGWNYGVFFTVFPMFLLAMIPVLNAHVVRQFLASAVLTGIEVSLVTGLTQHMPLINTGLVFLIFCGRFRLMARGPMFLFGANGVLTLSIMFHFASYPGVDVYDLVTSNFVASVLAVLIAGLMHWLFPDVAPRQAMARPAKPEAQVRHETLMGAITATLSFATFQIFDLRDSLSAQMATILILFALSFPGAQTSAFKRAIGALLGCNLALVMQVVLYNQNHHILLVILAYWLGLMIFARLHLLEGGGSAIGFGGLTTLGILFGQYLAPHQDLIYIALYRFSSMAVALVATLAFMACLHWLLNRWTATRAHDRDPREIFE